ncbi:hypothetical protein [Kitasatospora paranensis]|uniref:Phosphoribosyltransferase n=1 Tax=Kitasatospora paranensis TaxID=258053 RepID=A0ABW2G3S3_9ACTN
MRFSDRRNAGRQLGDRLARASRKPMVDPVVLALSRGGLAVAAEVARCLDAELAGEVPPGHWATQPPRPVIRGKGRTVVLVDDGLATGDAALSAVRDGWSAGAARVVVATPVCAPRAAASVRPVVDDLVCLSLPWYFRSVADWYTDYHRLSDHELAEALTSVRGTPRPSPALRTGPARRA